MKRHIFKLGPELSALIKNEDDGYFYDATEIGWSVFHVFVDSLSGDFGCISESLETETILIDNHGKSYYPNPSGSLIIVETMYCPDCHNRLRMRKMRCDDPVSYYCTVCKNYRK